MVLFNDVVEVFDLEDLDRASRTRELQDDIDAFQTRQIGPTLVDYDPIWHAIGANCPLEEPPRRSLVALQFREHEIKDFACLVDGSVIIGPPSLNLNVGFISHLTGHCKTMSREGIRQDMAVGRFRAWAFAAIMGENLITHHKPPRKRC